MTRREDDAALAQGGNPLKEENIDVMYREGLDISNPDAHYPGFKQEQTVLKAGTVVKEGAPAIVQDLLFERDVAVVLRDGTTIYTDVYRSAGVKDSLRPAALCCGANMRAVSHAVKIMNLSGCSCRECVIAS